LTAGNPAPRRLEIKEAFGSFPADALPGGHYRLTRPNADMKLILESMGAGAELRFPTVAELRKLKKAVDAAGRSWFHMSEKVYLENCLQPLYLQRLQCFCAVNLRRIPRPRPSSAFVTRQA
jgi:hypothetical protein